MTHKSLAILVLAALCASTNAAQAQETRTELLEKERAEKAARVEPYRAGRLERGLLYLEGGGLERLLDPDGFYPRLGGLTTGSGLAGGPGYRKRVFDGQMVIDVTGAVSTKRYRLLQTDLLFPELANQKLMLGAHFRYRDFPMENFFGLGNDTQPGDRTRYLLEDSNISGTAAVRLNPWLSFGGQGGYLNVHIRNSTDRRFPPILDFYDEPTAPGLTRQPNFLHGDLFLDVDFRDHPGNPRSGGHYRASVGRFHDRTLARHSFHRTHLMATHYLPFLERQRVIALRAQVIMTDADAGHEVPFYLLPTVGGHDTVRGFREYRFRQQNALILNAEYRWEAFAGLDMALFVDAGKVAADRSDLDFDDLKTSFGGGFRFNTGGHVFLRLDVARSREGLRFFLKFGPAF
jgi:outer membrane protein assembly factor BamA